MSWMFFSLALADDIVYTCDEFPDRYHDGVWWPKVDELLPADGQILYEHATGELPPLYGEDGGAIVYTRKAAAARTIRRLTWIDIDEIVLSENAFVEVGVERRTIALGPAGVVPAGEVQLLDVAIGDWEIDGCTGIESRRIEMVGDADLSPTGLYLAHAFGPDEGIPGGRPGYWSWGSGIRQDAQGPQGTCFAIAALGTDRELGPWSNVVCDAALGCSTTGTTPWGPMALASLILALRHRRRRTEPPR